MQGLFRPIVDRQRGQVGMMRLARDERIRHLQAAQNRDERGAQRVNGVGLIQAGSVGAGLQDPVGRGVRQAGVQELTVARGSSNRLPRP